MTHKLLLSIYRRYIMLYNFIYINPYKKILFLVFVNYVDLLFIDIFDRSWFLFFMRWHKKRFFFFFYLSTYNTTCDWHQWTTFYTIQQSYILYRWVVYRICIVHTIGNGVFSKNSFMVYIILIRKNLNITIIRKKKLYFLEFL